MLIGALASCYGPLIPYFESRYGVPRSTAGSVITAYFLGSLAGVGWTTWAARRMRSRSYLVTAAIAVALGTTVLAVAPSWWVVLAGAVVAGLGFGTLDFGLNRLFARGFGARRGALLNLLNGLYGAGAVAGPLVVAAAGRQHASWVFGGLALLALGAAPALAQVRGGTANAANAAGAAAGGATGARPARIRPDTVLVLFVCAYLLYMGVESGISSWEPTQLRAAGYSPAFADSATSAFWLCLTVGRFLVVPITLRVPAPRIVLAGIGASGAVLAAALWAGPAPYAYAIAGLALGPVFPTGLAWVSEAAPDRDAVMFLLAAATLGGAVFPLGTGWIIQRTGTAWTAAVAGSLALACAAVFTAIAMRRSADRG